MVAALLVFASLLVVAACTSVRSTSTTPQPAAVATPSAAPSPYVQQALYQPISGTCRATIRPDRAVIVGGMSASGIKPTETAMRLDRQLDVLRAVADEENATLRLVERVRAARSSSSRSRRGEQQEPEPYVVVQRIELETEVGADIDRLLEKTLQTGLDRYGSTAGVDARSAGSQPLVVYRFSELDALVRSAHDACRHAAIRTWCEAEAGSEAKRLCHGARSP